MPRNKDKDNAFRRGRRDEAPRKGRTGKPRGPEKKLAKRGGGEGEKRSFHAKGEGRPFRRRDDDALHRDTGDRSRPARSNRDDRPRSDRPDREPRKNFRPRDDRGGKQPSYRPPRPNDDRGDRGYRGGDFADRKRSYGERGDARPASRFADKKFGDKRPHAARAEGFRKDGERPRRDRPYADRPSRDGEKRFSRERGPRKDFANGPDRGDLKPWQRPQDREGRDSRPPREGARTFDKPRFGRSRDDRSGDERPRFSRSRDERQSGDRPFSERPKFARPRHGEGRTEWQEHPRSEGRVKDRFADRPRRDNEDDSKVFVKRPAFGGRGAYRERTGDFDRRPPREVAKPKKAGERIAKVLARAGIASRRDAEELVVQGRVTVNGRVINSPALDVTPNDVIAVDGNELPPRERTRLFLYHKPRGLMTTHADPEGRPTVFDNLPEGLPRLISVGRLDFNTEGLLLLTNDGGLARVLELPETGWLRRYRVRAHGEITQAQLDELKNGIEVDGVKYGPIDATLERDQGANVWLVFAIREGKNREVRNVLAHLGLEVNRLIRVSYGPFQLGELAEGEVQEVRSRVLREQLGEKIVAQAGADFALPGGSQPGDEEGEAATDRKSFRPRGKSALIEDRKGRRVLVQRAGSEEARERNEAEAAGWGPPRRPRRAYHGKRDLKPREE